jgi:hypothetical protein
MADGAKSARDLSVIAQIRFDQTQMLPMEAIDLPNRSNKSIGHTISNEAEMEDGARKEMGDNKERRQCTKRADGADCVQGTTEDEGEKHNR